MMSVFDPGIIFYKNIDIVKLQNIAYKLNLLLCKRAIFVILNLYIYIYIARISIFN